MPPMSCAPYVVLSVRESKMMMVKSRYARNSMPCTAFDQHSGRREVMVKTAAVMGSLLLPRFGRAQEPRKPTWMEIIGPFYPVEKPTDQDADLTQIEGRTERAQGEILYLSGRVFARDGTPVVGAVLEVWQANAAGRYAHIGDKNPAPLDPNFQAYARIVTDAEGRYSIKTIKPGAYPTPSGWMRAPHIHFDITGKVTRLVTAMYFEGDPLNDQDRILKTSFNPKSQMTQADHADASSEPAALKANWDIVLITG
jgi:protocatechuate 3,4-dioxygenase, beta subunit